MRVNREFLRKAGGLYYLARFRIYTISHGRAGAESIIIMKTLKEFRIGWWRAGRLAKESELVICQQPTHRLQQAGYEHIAILNHPERPFTVTAPNQVVRGDVYLNRQVSNVPRHNSRVAQESKGRPDISSILLPVPPYSRVNADNLNQRASALSVRVTVYTYT